MKIYELKGSSISKADRSELGRLLLEHGYAVQFGSEKSQSSTRVRRYVEFNDLSGLSLDKLLLEPISVRESLI